MNRLQITAFSQKENLFSDFSLYILSSKTVVGNIQQLFLQSTSPSSSWATWAKTRARNTPWSPTAPPQVKLQLLPKKRLHLLLRSLLPYPKPGSAAQVADLGAFSSGASLLPADVPQSCTSCKTAWMLGQSGEVVVAQHTKISQEACFLASTLRFWLRLHLSDCSTEVQSPRASFSMAWQRFM